MHLAASFPLQPAMASRNPTTTSRRPRSRACITRCYPQQPASAAVSTFNRSAPHFSARKDDEKANLYKAVCTCDPGYFGSSCDEVAGTCAEVRALDPSAADDSYILFVGKDPGKPWTAYCADMETAPLEYLDLSAGPDVNFSQYTAGNLSPGTNVRTNYSRVGLRTPSADKAPGAALAHDGVRAT